MFFLIYGAWLTALFLLLGVLIWCWRRRLGWTKREVLLFCGWAYGLGLLVPRVLSLWPLPAAFLLLGVLATVGAWTVVRSGPRTKGESTQAAVTFSAGSKGAVVGGEEPAQEVYEDVVAGSRYDLRGERSAEEAGIGAETEEKRGEQTEKVKEPVEGELKEEQEEEAGRKEEELEKAAAAAAAAVTEETAAVEAVKEREEEEVKAAEEESAEEIEVEAEKKVEAKEEAEAEAEIEERKGAETEREVETETKVALEVDENVEMVAKKERENELVYPGDVAGEEEALEQEALNMEALEVLATDDAAEVGVKIEDSPGRERGESCRWVVESAVKIAHLLPPEVSAVLRAAHEAFAAGDYTAAAGGFMAVLQSSDQGNGGEETLLTVSGALWPALAVAYYCAGQREMAVEALTLLLEEYGNKLAPQKQKEIEELLFFWLGGAGKKRVVEPEEIC